MTSLIFGCFISGFIGFRDDIIDIIFPTHTPTIISTLSTSTLVLTKTPIPITKTSKPTSYQTKVVPTKTRTLTKTPSPVLTRTPSPNMRNFSACLEACNGSNSTRSFPEASKKIYIEWDYDNIPYGSSYIRKWTMDGREWIKYNCTWTGNQSGRDSIKLTEPKGLHSGDWEMTIMVDDKILLKEKIKILGDWDYWDPAGTLNSCYGTTD